MYPHQLTTTHTNFCAQVSVWETPAHPPVSWRCYCCPSPACPCAWRGLGEVAGQATSILDVEKMCQVKEVKAVWKDDQKFYYEKKLKNDYG